MPPFPSIGLVPLGPVDPVILRRLKTALARILHLSVRLLKARELPSHTYHIVRKQHNSTQLLEYLIEDLPPGLFKVLGVTGVDLYIPILTHVFGEAQIGGPGAIISSYRLRQDENGWLVPPQLLWPRVIKAGVHELGHTFKLGHCRQPGCVMRFSSHLDKIDQKNIGFCDYCRVLLADYLNDCGIDNPFSRSREIPAPDAPSRAEDSVRKHHR
jgi:archaemetzincin